MPRDVSPSVSYYVLIVRFSCVDRFTRFRNWAVDTETQLKSLTESSKDPKFAVEVLRPEFESQIDSKRKEFDWLDGAGKRLVEVESNSNPELASTTERNLKEINDTWDNLNESLHRYTVEWPTRILVSFEHFVFVFENILLNSFSNRP